MKKALLTSNNTSIKQANKRKYIKGGAAKYNFNINENTNSDNIIKISTDSGRCCRPLLIVENNKIKLNNEMILKNLKIMMINYLI